MKSSTICFFVGIVVLAAAVVVESQGQRKRGARGDSPVTKMLTKFVSPECLAFIQKNVFDGGEINPMKLVSLVSNPAKVSSIIEAFKTTNDCTKDLMQMASKFMGMGA